MKIVPYTTNIKFPTTGTCLSFTPPAADKTTGIANSDLHIYLTYSSNGSTSTKLVGGACVYSKSPIFALLDFNSVLFTTTTSNK